MQQLRTEVPVKELSEITVKTDTRDILAHATIQAEALEDYFLVDIDAHVTETSFWNEIIELIDNDVIRQTGVGGGGGRGQRAPLHAAGAAGHGRHGARLPGGVSDTDAG